MNGPQRTAFLAKGYINNKLTVLLKLTGLFSLAGAVMGHFGLPILATYLCNYAIFGLVGSQDLCQTMNTGLTTTQDLFD